MTKVIDQSLDQTVPYSDIVRRQDLLTTSTTNTYLISQVDQEIILDLNGHRDLVGGQQRPHKFNNSGITLNTSTTATDQISVYYGGRLLRKTGVFYQDTTLSFDSPVTNLSEIEEIIDTSQLPDTEVIGESYLDISTNKVWIYENSLDQDAVKGFVYKGLNYAPPEFSVNTSTQAITLNIEDGIKDGVLLTIVKKEFARSNIWNNEITSATTVSLMESTTPPAKFLQAKPAELPDKYFYGGDPALIDISGFALTDENNKPLEGY